MEQLRGTRRHRRRLRTQGLALAAIAVAIMVPLANALCVVVLMRHTGNGDTDFAMLIKQLAQNPLILACIAGIAVQLLGLPIPKVASTTIDLVGKAALPLGLLAVGASLDLGHARARPSPIVAATILKLLVMPLLVAAGAWALGIDGDGKNRGPDLRRGPRRLLVLHSSPPTRRRRAADGQHHDGANPCRDANHADHVVGFGVIDGLRPAAPPPIPTPAMTGLFSRQHLLAIAPLQRQEIESLLDLGNEYVGAQHAKFRKSATRCAAAR